MPRRPRRWPGIVLLTVGLIAAGASLTWLSTDRQPPSTFGQPASAAAASEPAAPPAGLSPSVPAVAPGLGAVVTPSGATATAPMTAAIPAPATAPAPPTRLMIPGLSVDAPVDSVLSAGRVLHPPDDPVRVGWWIGSSLAGSDQGATVLVGHVDSAAAGPGAFFRLTDLEPGAEIILHTAGDAEVRYSVIALTDYPKTGDLPAELFRASGSPKLTLITCGGEFDEASQTYADNIVVTAAPAS